MAAFFKTTILGGMLFLLPLAIVLMVLGYLLEPLENGWSSVFLPQAPTPMSGHVMYLPAGRVRPLDITMVDAMAIIRRIGVGSGEALRGVDLKLPPGQ
jgi:uncharacterized membrane protein